MVTDTLGDMLTRIKNASAIRKDEVKLPYSKLCLAVAKVLVTENYLAKVDVAGEGIDKVLVLKLQYANDRPALSFARRISKPGVRIYHKTTALRPVLSGLGISLISTSQGIMSNKAARKAKLGGEVLAELY
ncbi:MAG: hypothetical protein ACD_27C00038G0014 [uncultured bacterium]|uniref:Small ribosomal subunit protein uS8 n=2 Tax=Candidatus Collieribacteriota TaxID=1752725 RepID=A0A1F5FXG2_9BACT|nr:MAG: hypothetical protein ACD_27C00038G0014 [uncultured bacterium]KKU21613.1 MAG: 30S ribosomal protein S8 [Microgenomates group bacterium GW2011_GWF1_46_12]KKU26883.1 MAG: 30S ribosomal protein S8 [Microgenomates group bacterium GW2011_GWC1_46_16]KKU28299.1 MAG: 30S ribosomal protein S8 [Microgenomates group bacterium GW2011_GWF2_46_18]KKU44144.1 MAG: 30S ribosomal protein S8 [Microgenomates group bacterium GW2011_GWA1_46_7]KKU45522.1 MAG: 30S ribosomal protein S8 [Microgenomates group bac